MFSGPHDDVGIDTAYKTAEYLLTSISDWQYWMELDANHRNFHLALRRCRFMTGATVLRYLPFTVNLDR